VLNVTFRDEEAATELPRCATDAEDCVPVTAATDVSIDEFRLLAASARLADDCGPLLTVDGLDPTDATLLAELRQLLGAEPCVVLGLDVIATTAEERSTIEATLTSAPTASISAAVLLRGGMGTVDERLAAESSVYSLLQAGPEFAAWRTRWATKNQRATNQQTEPAMPVLTHRDDTTLRVTLNRPTHGNAVNRDLRDGLCEALSIALLDPDVAVTLDANGPNFCTGGDLDEFGMFPDPSTSHVLRLQRSPARMLSRLSNRMCTYVHGTCAGSGIEFAAFSHRVIARPDTTFLLPELALGLVPGAGGTVSIVDRIGASRTLWMLLTGQHLDVSTALTWGLIDGIESEGTPP
jgi:hypothetical protein